MFTEMDKCIAHFYSGVDEFMLRYRIAQDVGTYFDEIDVSAITAEQLKKCAKTAIHTIIMEGVERGE